MKDVYLVDACRTPFGSFGGALSAVPATSMAAHLIKSLLSVITSPAIRLMKSSSARFCRQVSVTVQPVRLC